MARILSKNFLQTDEIFDDNDSIALFKLISAFKFNEMILDSYQHKEIIRINLEVEKSIFEFEKEAISLTVKGCKLNWTFQEWNYIDFSCC